MFCAGIVGVFVALVGLVLYLSIIMKLLRFATARTDIAALGLSFYLSSKIVTYWNMGGAYELMSFNTIAYGVALFMFLRFIEATASQYQSMLRRNRAGMWPRDTEGLLRSPTPADGG